MSSSSRPLPHLALETQAAVLRFCDPPTLAVSSRVCLAWLELAGSVLYEHVTIRGKEQLEMMIRSETVPASLVPFVSLAQTRSFTYIPLAVPRPFSNSQRKYDTPCLVSSTPWPIEELVVDLREAPLDGQSNVNVSTLLCSFDPVHLRIIGRPPRSDTLGTHVCMPSRPGWSQLRKVTLVRVLTWEALIDETALADREPLLDLVLDLEFPSDWGGENVEINGRRLVHFRDLRANLGSIGDAATSTPAFGHVQVWVSDEKSAAWAKEELTGCSCTSLEIGVKKPAAT